MPVKLKPDDVRPRRRTSVPMGSKTAVAVGVAAAIGAANVHAIDHYREIRGQEVKPAEVVQLKKDQAEVIEDDSARYDLWLENYSWTKQHFTPFFDEGEPVPKEAKSYRSAVMRAKVEKEVRSENSYIQRFTSSHRNPKPPTREAYRTERPVKGWEYMGRPPTVDHMFTYCQNFKPKGIAALAEAERNIRTSLRTTVAANDLQHWLIDSEGALPWALTPMRVEADWNTDKDDLWRYDHAWSGQLMVDDDLRYQCWLAKHEPLSKRVALQSYRKCTERWHPAWNYWLNRLKAGDIDREYFDYTMDKIKAAATPKPIVPIPRNRSLVLQPEASEEAERLLELYWNRKSLEAMLQLGIGVETPRDAVGDDIEAKMFELTQEVKNSQLVEVPVEDMEHYLEDPVNVMMGEFEEREYQDEQLEAHVQALEERWWRREAAKRTWKPYANGEVSMRNVVGLELKHTPNPLPHEVEIPNSYDAGYRELPSGVLIPRNVHEQLLFEDEWLQTRYSDGCVSPLRLEA